MRVKEVATLDEFTKNVVECMRPYLKDGIEIKTVEKMLKDQFEVPVSFHPNLVDEIKEEVGMYSNDGKHLKFAELPKEKKK